MTIGFVEESIRRGERGMDTTWMPYMWPIKTCLLVGIIFLLEAIEGSKSPTFLCSNLFVLLILIIYYFI